MGSFITIIYGLSIVFISFAVLTYNYFVFKKLSLNNILFKFIEFLIFYKVFFYMLIPAILRTFSEFQYEVEISIEPLELLTIYLFESISYFIWISVFYIFTSKLKFTHISRYYSKIVESIFLIILVLYIYFIFTKALELFGYSTTNLFDSTLYVLYPLVNILGPVLAFFGLIYYKYDNKNNKMFALSIIAVLTYLVVSLISGIRGLIVHPAFFVLFLLFIYGKKRHIKYIFMSLVAFAMFQSSFMQIRHLDSDTKLEMLASGNIGEEKKSLLNEIEWRYGEASRMSVAFLRRGMDDNFAGIQPLLSSMHAPLPRSMFPDKPIPGSIGEDKYSMGFYLINADIRGQWWNMTEFLTSAHAYWEFGILGILIITIISAMYISFLTVVFLRVGVLGIPLLLLFFKPWGYNEPKIWLYEIPLQIFQYIVPLMTLFISIILIMSIKKMIYKILLQESKKNEKYSY